MKLPQASSEAKPEIERFQSILALQCVSIYNKNSKKIFQRIRRKDLMK